MTKNIYFILMTLLLSMTGLAQDSKWSNWIPLNSYLEGRAKVAVVEEGLVGYNWEFKLREKLFVDDPVLRNETLYARVFQTMPKHLTANKGDYNYDTPLRFAFVSAAHTKIYSAPSIFWMPKTKKNEYEQYAWKEGQIFPLATRGQTEFLHWGASLRIDEVLSGNRMRFSEDKGNLEKYIKVN
jgi:hypothetical protein